MVTARALKFDDQQISHAKKGKAAEVAGVRGEKLSQAFLILDFAPWSAACYPAAGASSESERLTSC